MTVRPGRVLLGKGRLLFGEDGPRIGAGIPRRVVFGCEEGGQHVLDLGHLVHRLTVDDNAAGVLPLGQEDRRWTAVLRQFDSRDLLAQRQRIRDRGAARQVEPIRRNDVQQVCGLFGERERFQKHLRWREVPCIAEDVIVRQNDCLGRECGDRAGHWKLELRLGL